jgi:hypothetical protein
MADETEYISRPGTISAPAAKVFRFVRDIRNFGRFVPQDTFKKWEADADSCSFEISPLGKASIAIAERDPESKVKYEGSAFNNTSFRLWFQFREPEEGVTRFRIVIRADLNPFYKLMANGPVNEFLEKVVSEIENYNDWDEVFTDTQSP